MSPIKLAPTGVLRQMKMLPKGHTLRHKRYYPINRPGRLSIWQKGHMEDSSHEPVSSEICADENFFLLQSATLYKYRSVA